MPDVSSYIYRKATSPETRTMISSRNRIYSFAAGVQGYTQLGDVSNFAVTNSRDVSPTRGIGFGDQIAELVPGVSEPVSISISRFALYTSMIMQVLGYRAGIDGIVRALKHHRWPFDIKQEIIFSELASKENLPVTGPLEDATMPGDFKALLTLYEGCWLSNVSTTFASDTTIVSEDVDLSVTDILEPSSRYEEALESGNSPFFDSPNFSRRFNPEDNILRLA